jgi:hypothetical protein
VINPGVGPYCSASQRSVPSILSGVVVSSAAVEDSELDPELEPRGGLRLRVMDSKGNVWGLGLPALNMSCEQVCGAMGEEASFEDHIGKT